MRINNKGGRKPIQPTVSANFTATVSVEFERRAGISSGMTKKQKYLEQVRKLYVEKHLTLKEIAGRLPVSYATLRRWSEQEGWELEKKESLLKAEAFHKELYELGRELSADIRKDIRQGKEVKPARYYALGRIMDIVDKTHKYEQKVRELEKGGKKETSLKDILKTLNEHLFSDEQNS